MASQSIFINTSGAVETLRKAKGKGIQLRDIAPSTMRRVSDIRFNEDNQKFYIFFLNEDSKFYGAALKATLSIVDNTPMPTDDYRVLFFDEYEDAVECEIHLVDSLRRLFGVNII